MVIYLLDDLGLVIYVIKSFTWINSIETN